MQPASPDDMDALAHLVQSLPPELYDKIYEEVFIFAEGYKCTVTKGFKPPARSQVNRSSRTVFAQAYYSSTVFLTDAETTAPWLKSLPKAHRDMLREVHCVNKEGLDEQMMMLMSEATSRSRKSVAYGLGKHLMRHVQGELMRTDYDEDDDDDDNDEDGEDEEDGDARLREGVIRWVVHYSTGDGGQGIIFFGEDEE